MEEIDRREFSVQAILMMLSGVVITVSGCGSGSSPSSGSSTPGTGRVSDNHGHVAVVTSAQLAAGGAVTLDIQGSATHSHSVTLSATEVVQVRDGVRVVKTSTTGDGHTHTVTFN